MKKSLILISILLISLCLLACNGVAVESENVTSNYDDVTFDIEYHRGGRNQRPENTLYSYLYAIENGASTIGCDMQLIADGTIVMSHNPF